MAKIEIKGIGELLGNTQEGRKALHFIIPSYQRGYRWDKQQVEDLLNDVWEFSKKQKEEGEFYCLQPIIVKKDEQGRYVLIDGQQRLTTIFIILKCLENRIKEDYSYLENFSLEYQTRKDSKDFLDNLKEENEDNANKNIDYHFMFQTYKKCSEFFKKEGINKGKFVDTLLVIDKKKRTRQRYSQQCAYHLV
ncbi:GmrSD restriction endonuclease domain-containing protein [Helicobacter cetorum]|uniref:GmrSD restriction endonuclease domain-containing protein n=1 Tax=Helicobacter cetorum TaxID=138563 RepID=UPI000CF1BA40|nr:DUF262 domain-containing protein [Helicobacter cetorum]